MRLFRSFNIWIFSTLLFFFGCDSETDELTAITHEGLGTFSCLKNGRVWLAWCSGMGILGMGGWCAAGKEHVLDDYFQILAYNQNEGQIAIYIREPVSLNDILVGNDSLLYIIWSLNPAIEGKVTVSHFDTSKKIIAGLFNFVAVDSHTFDTLKFTDGRFDLRYD